MPPAVIGDTVALLVGDADQITLFWQVPDPFAARLMASLR